jgi:protein-disulfide isomerase
LILEDRLAKVRRKVVTSNKTRGLSTPVVLVVLGVAVIAVATIAVVLLQRQSQPGTPATGDPQKLATCGSIPCPTKGDPNAPVKLIDVSSFTCSHCRDYVLTVEPLIEEQYIKTGKVLYIGHPLGFESQAQGLAAAAFCAGDQGKYWEYSSLLFKNQGKFDANSLSLYAQQAGLDAQAFAACVNSGKHSQDAINASNSAMAAGVDATPTFFINGKSLVGAMPFSEFQTRIEDALKSAK